MAVDRTGKRMRITTGVGGRLVEAEAAQKSCDAGSRRADEQKLLSAKVCQRDQQPEIRLWSRTGKGDEKSMVAQRETMRLNGLLLVEKKWINTALAAVQHTLERRACSKWP
jgi:hypothetical protein